MSRCVQIDCRATDPAARVHKFRVPSPVRVTAAGTGVIARRGTLPEGGVLFGAVWLPDFFKRDNGIRCRC
ncbi:Uncharacterised protein [Mycobacteroides abscessus subsp. abscessus]|nr:Uncharacterised protein [Mycobacteroides abscessus subsp. abscessus]